MLKNRADWNKAVFKPKNVVWHTLFLLQAFHLSCTESIWFQDLNAFSPFLSLSFTTTIWSWMEKEDGNTRKLNMMQINLWRRVHENEVRYIRTRQPCAVWYSTAFEFLRSKNQVICNEFTKEIIFNQMEIMFLELFPNYTFVFVVKLRNWKNLLFCSLCINVILK